MPNITLGRIVHYVLSKDDAALITAQRTAYTGNPVQAGDTFPAAAVAVWGDGTDVPVNLQVWLDGRDTFWATSRHEDQGNEPGVWTQGKWHFPIKA